MPFHLKTKGQKNVQLDIKTGATMQITHKKWRPSNFSINSCSCTLPTLQLGSIIFEFRGTKTNKKLSKGMV
jgi:hypothetical protein